MVDLRRAVDLLQSRDDVDDDRIAYVGVSYGAAMGGLLAGIEDRIAAFVLASGDGGLVSHFTGTGAYAGGPLSQLPPARRERWLDAMRPIEPVKWIGRADAPILFLSGRNDELVPPANARKYQQAAHEPKDVRWYDSGHLPPPKGCATRHAGSRSGSGSPPTSTRPADRSASTIKFELSDELPRPTTRPGLAGVPPACRPSDRSRSSLSTLCCGSRSSSRDPALDTGLLMAW